MLKQRLLSAASAALICFSGSVTLANAEIMFVGEGERAGDPFKFSRINDQGKREYANFGRLVEMYRGIDDLKAFVRNNNSKSNFNELSKEGRILVGLLTGMKDGGLKASFYGEHLEDIKRAAASCSAGEEADTKQLIARMRIYYNDDTESGNLRVESSKRITCDGELTNEFINRKWVVTVVDGFTKKPLQQGNFPHRIEAYGTNIRLLSFYRYAGGNPFEPPVRIDKDDEDFGHYYDVSRRSCLEISSKIDLTGAHDIITTAEDAMFCAGGCRDGDIDATK